MRWRALCRSIWRELGRGRSAFDRPGLPSAYITDILTNMPSPVRFAIVRKLLEDNGWVLVRVKGSHHSFTKAGVGTYSVPVHHGHVKHGYYKEARRRCGIE
jgi:predicted RNA binding protein YcfA (HicA-like mRNA interferase family)